MEQDIEEPLLNELAWDLVNQLMTMTEELRIEPIDVDSSAVVLDFGIETPGSLNAGIALAEICLAGMADLSLVPGDVGGVAWQHLFVQSDQPVEACLLSQYAGWQIALESYFAMGSGPMRAAACKEPLFDKLGYSEDAFGVVGILESGKLPTPEVIQYIAAGCDVPEQNIALLVAPTSSMAGNMQVVARSVETALHKLFELGFDVNRIESAAGCAPISPVAADDLTGIGRTNDSILYGGRVTLWVHGDDDSIAEIGSNVPSATSSAYGKPFLQVFEEAGRDFYKIDPHLFSPAQIVFQNVQTGKVHHFGGINHDILKQSFGL